MLIFVMCSLAGMVNALAQAQGPVAQWSFEETSKGRVHDSVPGLEDELAGLYKRVAGVSGSALRFDGMTTSISRKPGNVPQINAGFSVEAWIAIGTYPWNWVPILDHRIGEDAGYFVGVDSFGHLGVQAAINGAWRQLTSQVKIPLKKWTHVAAAFDPRQGLTIYLNGRPAGALQVQGPLRPAQHQSLLIGRTREPILPAGYLFPRHPILYSFDGIIDELKLFDHALAASQVASDFAAVTLPGADPLTFPVLPSGPSGPGPFGAYYATLKYDELWDASRRVGPESDVVVRFDALPIRLVFWQGTSYIPAWVTENGKWYTDEWMETVGSCPPGQDCEPLSDRQVRYARVRILESTPARAVVHYRYNLCDTVDYRGANEDPLTGWTDWGDEYYTIYPDGVAVRKQVFRSSTMDDPLALREFQESIVINAPGTRPEDNIAAEALSVANMKGETAIYSWSKPRLKVVQPLNSNIQMVNLKSKWKPFQIVPDAHAAIDVWNGAGAAADDGYSLFGAWNHWPVSQVASSGITATAPDKPSHTSLSHVMWDPLGRTDQTMTKILLHGLTEKPIADLRLLARSWLTPPALDIATAGFTGRGYDREQRAFVIDRQGSATQGMLRLSIHATQDSPLIDPAFVVKGWGRKPVRLKVNGKAVAWGADFRQGWVESLEQTDLVVWMRFQSTTPATLELDSGDRRW